MAIYSLIFILVISLNWTNNVLCEDNSTSDANENCICDVRYFGQYCGITLNEKSTKNQCNKDMYFCGKSNLKSAAVLLKTCKMDCDQQLNGGNACYQNVKCLCPPELQRKKKYCGSELTGVDCQPNIVYRCPMVRRYQASPEDACPFGCENGKCVTAAK
ncbi:hypothetical protein DERP_012906 [Dermatophagoides pteronyssinus]|uniref:Uncharacterized protein n=1 Tax=Dermatophagoides pteronyssinus TaxID=6956 RepID=A0ABQ8J1S9_DERPT|nr:hypothetical protein DERP_012906 [Dermatophagoides pteronyssinus]